MTAIRSTRRARLGVAPTTSVQTSDDSPAPYLMPGAVATGSGSGVQLLQTLTGASIGEMSLEFGTISAAPATYSNLVIFGESSTSGLTAVHAYDVRQGRDIWAPGLQVSGSIDATPAIYDDVLYVAANNGFLYVFNLQDVQRPQTTAIFNFLSLSPGDVRTVSATVLSSDKTLLFAVTAAGVYGIDVSSPSVAWSACPSDDLTGCPALLVGESLIVASGSTVTCLSTSGSTLWSRDAGTTVTNLWSADSFQILAPSASGGFQVFDAATGAPIGSVDLSVSGINYQASRLFGDLLAVVDTSGALHVYRYFYMSEASTYTELWSLATGGLGAGPVLWGQVLYLIDTTSALTALDMRTGTVMMTASASTSPGVPLVSVALLPGGTGMICPESNFAGTPLYLSSDEPDLSSIGFTQIASGGVGAQSSYVLFYQQESFAAPLDELYLNDPAISPKATPASSQNFDLSDMLQFASAQSLSFSQASMVNWLSAIQENQWSLWFVQATGLDVLGTNVSMLDFAEGSIVLARQVEPIVSIGGSGSPIPAGVEVALAVSGSTAQGAIVAYPGDLDFTERVNIVASDRASALTTLSTIVLTRATTSTPVSGFEVDLIEVKYGLFPYDFQYKQGGKVFPQGSPISWSPDALAAQSLSGFNASDGSAVTISWTDDAVVNNPGFVKLDWIFAKLDDSTVMNTSNVVDPTWQSASTNEIATLDDGQDAFLSEIYLDASDADLVQVLYQNVAATLLEAYVEQLEAEVKKFAVTKQNWGKVAKRLYNLYRINQRDLDGSYVREIFRQPFTVVYQVWSRMKGVAEAATESNISPALIAAQVTALIGAIQSSSGLDDSTKTTLVNVLTPIQTALSAAPPLPQSFQGLVITAQSTLLATINALFEPVLMSVPGIASYVQTLASQDLSPDVILARFPRIHGEREDWDG